MDSSPHSLVGKALNLKTRGCGFDFRAGQPNNYFKHIYFTSIEKQVPTTYTNLSRDSNSGLHDCKADALPHDHGQHQT